MCRVETYPFAIGGHHSELIAPGGGFDGLSVAEYTTMIADAGVQVHVVAACPEYGRPRFHSRLLPGVEASEDALPDFVDPLRQFIELAHERDMLVLSYVGLFSQPGLATLHPEWLMEYLDDPAWPESKVLTDEKGKPGFENRRLCPSSPFRSWLVAFLLETVERLDLNGWYFDGTNLGSHGSGGYRTGCCCAYCARAFTEATGHKIPAVVDFSLPQWPAFLAWRRALVSDFMREIAQAVRAVKPDAVLDYNHYGGAYNRWDLGHSTGLGLPGDADTKKEIQ
eukprot:SAG11_NODE_2988_length_2787_cov_8.062500_1_plen_281_part_00